MAALLVLVAVTVVWGLTFVQVKDAVAVYPLFPFLAVRFLIAALVLAPFGWNRLRRLGPSGVGAAALAGALLAAGYSLQTFGLERTSVSGAGFITGMYVVLTPLLALLLFRVRSGASAWGGVVLATLGLGLLAGVHAGSVVGDLCVLAAAAVYALQIVLMERYAPQYDAFGFTFLEMAFTFLLLGVLAAPSAAVPRGWTVWGALLVTGIVASALGFLVQTWVQRETNATRTALVFSLEPVWAALFGFTIAGDRLGVAGWAGCAVIMAGIVLAEPAAAGALARLLRVRAA